MVSNENNLRYRPPDGLIITVSGMRGIIGKNITPEVITRFIEAYGMWLRDVSGSRPKILVGTDPRTSGPMIKNLTIGALLAIGVDVIDADICPTPILIYGHKKLECNGTVIISASHNPPEYNGLKCLGPNGTFLGDEDLKAINEYFYGNKAVSYAKWDEIPQIRQITDLPKMYFEDMKKSLNLEVFQRQKDEKRLRVIVDTGCGAGTGITAEFLNQLGCDALEVNNKRNPDGSYPRMFEPTVKHLHSLKEIIEEKGCDVAFAHDFDADRITLINERGEIYREDIIVALLWDHLLNKIRQSPENKDKKIVLITNNASSLMLDDIAAKYDAQIIHTAVGERNLAVKMMEIKNDSASSIVFGGEGSCGGFMYPDFNNTRDGIFSAILICEMLLERNKSISELAEQLPHYETLRRNIKLKDHSAKEIMDSLKKLLKEKGIEFEVIANDVKIIGKKEWTLVHPSNTEPIIRVITEANELSRTQELIDKMFHYIEEAQKL